MSDETPPSTITEALERAARLHAEALRQIEELLRDEDSELREEDRGIGADRWPSK